MNDVTAKSLLIQLQCTNKDITEAQNDALSYVISFLDEIKNKADNKETKKYKSSLALRPCAPIEIKEE